MTEIDIDRIIGQITKKLLIIILPTILLTFGSVFAYDHFTLKNKVDREEYYKNYGEILLLIESKNKAIDELAKSNSKDVSYIRERVDRLDKIQSDIDAYLRQRDRVRGFRNDNPN